MTETKQQQEPAKDERSPFPAPWWNIEKWDWDALIEQYATAPYLIVAALWTFSIANYYPMIFNGYYQLLEESGGPILAIPMVYLLALIPLGVLPLCLMMVKKGKDIPARVLAIAPAVRSFMLFYGLISSFVGNDAMKAKNDYLKNVQQELEKED